MLSSLYVFKTSFSYIMQDFALMGISLIILEGSSPLNPLYPRGYQLTSVLDPAEGKSCANRYGVNSFPGIIVSLVFSWQNDKKGAWMYRKGQSP